MTYEPGDRISHPIVLSLRKVLEEYKLNVSRDALIRCAEYARRELRLRDYVKERWNPSSQQVEPYLYYSHYGIVLSNDRVLHMTRRYGLAITTIEQFSCGTTTSLVSRPLDREPVLRRAWQLYHHSSPQYQVWMENCEHLANYCMTGRLESDQVTDIEQCISQWVTSLTYDICQQIYEIIYLLIVNTNNCSWQVVYLVLISLFYLTLMFPHVWSKSPPSQSLALRREEALRADSLGREHFQ